MEFNIRCPKCAWQPKANSRWSCTCGHSWNTFDTGGRCPKCKKQWKDTCCQGPWVGGCAQWSPHLDWYEGLDDAFHLALEEVLEKELLEQS